MQGRSKEVWGYRKIVHAMSSQNELTEQRVKEVDYEPKKRKYTKYGKNASCWC